MSEFTPDLLSYKRLLQDLRFEISRAPIELQLMWLFEVAMTKAFLLLVVSKRFSVNPRSGNYRMNESDTILAYDKEFSEIIGRLQHYRDSFVHKGFACAAYDFDRLKSMRTILERFCKQDIINISLNWENKMF